MARRGKARQGAGFQGPQGRAGLAGRAGRGYHAGMNEKARPHLDAKALHHYRTLLAVQTGHIYSLSEAADDAVRRASALLAKATETDPEGKT